MQSFFDNKRKILMVAGIIICFALIIGVVFINQFNKSDSSNSYNDYNHNETNNNQEFDTVENNIENNNSNFTDNKNNDNSSNAVNNIDNNKNIIKNNENSLENNNSKNNNTDADTENKVNTSYNNNNNNNDNTDNNKSIVNATKEYYCVDNYVLNGTKCQYKFSGDALQRYACDVGTLDGSKCVRYSSIVISTFSNSVTAQCEYLLNSGHYNSCLCTKAGGQINANDKKCYKNQKFTSDAKLEYYCTGDLKLEGNKCVKYYSLDAMYKYTCPNGYTQIGDKCQSN